MWKFSAICLLVFVASSLATDDDRIFGGQEARRGQFPYLASIRRTATALHICGGGIVSDRFILTAAHCVQSRPEAIRVSVGAHSRFDNHTVYTVSRIVLHPRYRENPLAFDIAVVQTARRIIFGQFVRSIRLPTSNLPDQNGIRLTLAGWGLYRVSVS